jgi:hypothetical protein
VSGSYTLDREPEEPRRSDYWSADDCAFDDERYAEAWGAAEIHGYSIEGTVTVNEGDGQVLAGSWEGALVGDEPSAELEGVGTSGSFATAPCELDWPDLLVWM